MEITKSSGQVNEKVHQMLQEYNAQYMEDSGDYIFYIEEDGKIAAGIVATAVFDTVEIDYLCVAEGCRSHGYGLQLLNKVEKEAAAKQIKRIILNTYSFQAPNFYKKLGYKQLFKIAPAFKDYDQYYFIKEL
ncbi:GNAT family N-acetyltransferase [Lactobacillus sp. 23-2]|uniref:GNAT family N-acetyltransferase n=1 Tax=Lactobacillus sp. 23-2 TaxID=2981842 RepID=UPI003838E8ED